MKPLVLLLLISGAAWAAPVDKVLMMREHVVTAEEVRALGPRADRLLIGVASDARSSRLRRARALLALRHVPSEEAREFLRAVIADKREAVEGADVLDLAAALTSLSPYGREVLTDLLAFVAHRSADVRHAAISALGAVHEPEAESAIRARLYVERDPGVRDAAARALAHR
jgi:HEAT repeat protein